MGYGSNARGLTSPPESVTVSSTTLSLPGGVYNAKLSAAASQNVDVVDATGAFSGQTLILWGTDDTNSIVFRDNQSGTNLNLKNATRTLQEDDCLILQWDADVSLWKEMGFVQKLVDEQQFTAAFVAALTATNATVTTNLISSLVSAGSIVFTENDSKLMFGASTLEGARIAVHEEDVVFTTALAAKDLAINFTGHILAVQANLETAVTATTAVKVGIGVAGDLDKYGLTTGLTKNLKITTLPTPAIVSAEDVQVYACDTAGAAAGTLDTGTVRVRIVYLTATDLVDAP